jgi:hypothetical protein
VTPDSSVVHPGLPSLSPTLARWERNDLGTVRTHATLSLRSGALGGMRGHRKLSFGLAPIDAPSIDAPPFERMRLGTASVSFWESPQAQATAGQGGPVLLPQRP